MKVKFTAKSNTIKHLLGALELDKIGDVDLVIDVTETPRNKAVLEKFKNCMTRLENYNPMHATQPYSRDNGGIPWNFPLDNQIKPTYGYGRMDSMPTTLDELDDRIRKMVYSILDEEYGSDPVGSLDRSSSYTPKSDTTNLFAGNFNPTNQQNYLGITNYTPGQVDINQDNDLVNSLLKPNVCGVDLNTVQGIAVITIAVIRTVDSSSYSLSSSIIKNSIEWIRNGNGTSENLAFDYNIVSKVTKKLGVEEWKQRMNRFLKYGSNVRGCSLASALDYMYT